MYKLTESDERFQKSTEIDWIRDVTLDSILNNPKLIKKYLSGGSMSEDQIAKARAEAEEFEGRGIGAKVMREPDGSFKAPPGAKMKKGLTHEKIVDSIIKQQDFLDELDKKLDSLL